MNEILHQFSVLSKPGQVRCFKLGPARIALLLVLSAAGLGLAARSAIQLGSLADTRVEAVKTVREYTPIDAASPSGSLQVILAHPDRIPSHEHSLVGSPAPDFALADTEGKVWNLRKSRAGGSLVLIFYHGYLCPNCVRQLFDINRDLPLFGTVGAHVVALSADPPELTRQRFQQHGRFGFPVLWDPENKVRQAYRVFRRVRDGKTAELLRHGTFIIDREGKVQWANIGDAPFRRNSALLYQLTEMEGGALR